MARLFRDLPQAVATKRLRVVLQHGKRRRSLSRLFAGSGTRRVRLYAP